MTLNANHARMLEASGISPEVITARGYQSLTRKTEVTALGFSATQTNVPGLLLPVHSPTGDVSLYQFRPDQPRIGPKGKPVKYETPRGARMALDVPPASQLHVGDPSVPLIVTEGVKKADAAASRGLCAVALLGVWNFTGTNEQGGKTALAEWRDIALNGRAVHVCYDSDVMHKPEVHRAMAELAAFLRSRGASVAFIYLPHGEAGRKVGLDDYLVAGHTTDELLALSTRDLRLPPETGESRRQIVPYRATPDGLFWDKPSGGGPIPTQLTNFTARITGDVLRDDGADSQRQFDMEARLGERAFGFQIPAAEFDGLRWATKFLGATAIVFPGLSVRDHTAVAIKQLSGDVIERRVYAHTGWRDVDGGQWVYLHAAGGLGEGGATDAVSVHLPPALERFALPVPPSGAELVGAVRASLGLLEFGPDTISVPLLASAYRAVFGGADFSLFLVGASGTFKSEAAALVQQHFGPGLDAHHLPGSWSSTANALEGTAFTLKDTVYVIDDYAPSGSMSDVQRLQGAAERVLWAQGNHSGRGRMNADSTLRNSRPPRGLILATGEDVPPGQSLRARLLVVEVSRGDIPPDRLTACQRDAAAGLYAQSMAGFLTWLAPRYDAIRRGMKAETDKVRECLGRLQVGQVGHRRTPETTAQLAVGWRYFLRYARSGGVITGQEEEALWKRGIAALLAASGAQAQHQAASEPTQRFLELLAGALSAGHAHVASPSGDAPRNPGAWGWRSVTVSGDVREEPKGLRIGWVDGDDVYLQPEAAYNVAKRMGSDGSEGLFISQRTLFKRLKERHLLLTTDPARGTLTMRRMLEGSRKVVLHLAAMDLMGGEPAQPDQPYPNAVS